MTVVALFVTAALLGMVVITLSNLLLFPRLKARGSVILSAAEQSEASSRPAGRAQLPASSFQFISILIPARNEAAVISDTVRRILAQTYRRFELIVLDDHSIDGTPDIARVTAGGDARLRVISGVALPTGWGGKNWACYQLAEAAQGEWLLFTDADTIWDPNALAALVAEMTRTRCDLLTVWPTQVTLTWPERLVVPLMALVISGYLPVFTVHHTPWSPFAAANGQCLLFRRRAYDAIGGHAALKGDVLEDVKFARRIKAARLRLRMADGNRLIACRMYSDWPSVRDGYAKNILSGYGGSLFALALATLFHWLVFLWPWVWLAAGDAGSWKLEAGALAFKLPGWPVWPLVLIALGIGLRAVTAWFTRQRVRDALLMPVSVLLMTAIAARSAYWQIRFGGPVWKGRVVGKL